VDLREDFKTTHKAGALSAKLTEAIAARLAGGTQSLILINRRGYSWFVICRSCGAGIQCENCSISLTYHKQRDRLECHYCGFSRRVPKTCPKCASEHVYFFGAGAEQLEEKLREKFPGAKVARLDRDAGGGRSVTVGRLFPDNVLDYRFVVLGHNTVRGAAGAATGAACVAAAGFATGVCDHAAPVIARDIALAKISPAATRMVLSSRLIPLFGRGFFASGRTTPAPDILA